MRPTPSCTRLRASRSSTLGFLLLALARRDELGIARCAACGGVRVRDLLAKQRTSCANCGPSGAAAPLRVDENEAALPC
ncbi:MAG: hypothetical protein ABSG29_06750 [Steroidobacteraceae bacterium]|jgi:hypothetical protein